MEFSTITDLIKDREDKNREQKIKSIETLVGFLKDDFDNKAEDIELLMFKKYGPGEWLKKIGPKIVKRANKPKTLSEKLKIIKYIRPNLQERNNYIMNNKNDFYTKISENIINEKGILLFAENNEEYMHETSGKFNLFDEKMLGKCSDYKIIINADRNLELITRLNKFTVINDGTQDLMRDWEINYEYSRRLITIKEIIDSVKQEYHDSTIEYLINSLYVKAGINKLNSLDKSNKELEALNEALSVIKSFMNNKK